MEPSAERKLIYLDALRVITQLKDCCKMCMANRNSSLHAYGDTEIPFTLFCRLNRRKAILADVIVLVSLCPSHSLTTRLLVP